jgi:hypothetical protein
MKTNHHWAVHIPQQVRDFGTLYSFWAFLTERLNKILKNVNSNNWGGGLLEVSMMREFHRAAKRDDMVCKYPVLLNVPKRMRKRVTTLTLMPWDRARKHIIIFYLTGEDSHPLSAAEAGISGHVLSVPFKMPLRSM